MGDPAPSGGQGAAPSGRSASGGPARSGTGDPDLANLATRHPALRTLMICVGAQKAGTTWIHGMLSRHPSFHPAPIKELRFWDWRVDREERFALASTRRRIDQARLRRWRALLRPWDMPSAQRALALWEAYQGVLVAAGTPEGVRRYAAFLMRGYRGQPAAGELTPNYQLLGADDFRAMSALHPDARFLFVLRDPVERLWSGVKHRFRMEIAAGRIDGDALIAAFRDAVADSADRNHRRSDYRPTITALEAAVPAQRILYLFYETLFAQGTFDRITAFLGIEPAAADATLRINESRKGGLRPPARDLDTARRVFAPVYDAMENKFGSALPGNWAQAA